MIDQTHYETLDVRPASTAAEIRAAFLALADKHHPDKPGGDGDKFAGIAAAYSVLKDEFARRAYDATLRLLDTPCKPCNGKGMVWFSLGFTGGHYEDCKSCGGSGRSKEKK
jgi:DnaJ-class molecular chaperone